ncbi:hypothetical protein AciX9_4155 (plasmid) [Granulicella tundricola MP5ACTX9]|uniref:PilZ domain-containing protein n=2 Tax=Granulicella TaxID=940557 RepID=E8X651_GRATM|nr:hypothetical protein AciX9_4155 [Granulicella tundricola MP5ACTX9]
MDLILGDAVILGVCLNLSESGLRGTFSHPVLAGAEGLLTIYQGEQNVQIHARVYSLKGDEARIRFRFDSEQEQQNIREFLKLVTPSSPKSWWR